ncbi:MAG: Type 1 glutamine amidotransferase-like domain-containing protein [Clostridia bacterium]|nr:Type 1 glutamine amidotransferase-like domain-containing protein [Clostridia bacterium]
MLILTSNGLTSEILLNSARKYINGGKAALIVTADNEYKEKNHNVPHLSCELAALGLEVELFDFDKQTPAELEKYDVAEMIGGNPYYLLHSIRKNGFVKILSDFAENKCLIGSSAGSLVMTPSIDLVDMFSPEMNIVNLNDLSACNLTDIRIVPHYSKFIARFDGLEEKCVQYEKANACKLIRLEDGEAVIVRQEKTEIIRNQ